MRHTDGDLVVAIVGRLVAEEEQVVAAVAHRVRDRRCSRLGAPVRAVGLEQEGRPIPIAIAFRSCSSAAAGPSVSTVVSPPMRTASSTAHSSCGEIVKPR